MFRFLPWKYIVQRAARAYGLADPALWLARIRNFAQPSEVQEPIELLRAGVLFHARGIVNTKAIQHNLDWVWPYWVERQFDPNDVSFIPRGFSFSQINLTHRNWTAVGLPDLPLYPIVDPRGLVTPIQDGWSIDFWLFAADGRRILPSRMRDEEVRQELTVRDAELSVVTAFDHRDLEMQQRTYVALENSEPVVRIDVQAIATPGSALIVAIRPFNPEGVQFIDRAAARENSDGWRINGELEVVIDRPADELLLSDYVGGDVYGHLAIPPSKSGNGRAADHIHCRTGMVTAASVYRFSSHETQLSVRVPLPHEMEALHREGRSAGRQTWPMAWSRVAKLQIPDARMQFLYDAAVQTLILLSAGEIVPGPYTYCRFWFRDACLMMNALLAIGAKERCRTAIDRFPERQLASGYFRSQEGEWDSNGQVLWILDRYETLTSDRLGNRLMRSTDDGIEWIERKRIRGEEKTSLHAGLLPAGFSAEHLGPNDHYYWDNFWAEAGLRAAERIYQRAGRAGDAGKARRIADDLRNAIQQSIERIPARRAQGGIPASPYRRLDAGAVGSLVADYPLQLYPPAAPRIMRTIEALMRHSFHHGGFFQNIIHSGINAYLTLDIAQTLLRAGDMRYRDLVQRVCQLATSTGQWPEAIHPHTGGGCMGDGQHGWAAAEWVVMIRNMFVREEGDRLIVGSGIFAEWLQSEKGIRFGPTLTPWGRVTVQIEPSIDGVFLEVSAQWRGTPPEIHIAVPGFVEQRNVDVGERIRLEQASEVISEPSSGSR